MSNAPIIVSFGLLCSSFFNFAQAYPAVGDLARYWALLESKPLIYEKRILASRSGGLEFQVEEKTIYQGEVVQERVLWLAKTWLYTPEKARDVLKNCVKREGARGEVIIQNQRISVCEFYNEDSGLTSMVGDVPFGQVRFQVYLQDEDFLDFNLERFSSKKR